MTAKVSDITPIQTHLLYAATYIARGEMANAYMQLGFAKTKLAELEGKCYDKL